MKWDTGSGSPSDRSWQVKRQGEAERQAQSDVRLRRAAIRTSRA